MCGTFGRIAIGNPPSLTGTDPRGTLDMAVNGPT
jgi:hypothetical protein